MGKQRIAPLLLSAATMAFAGCGDGHGHATPPAKAAAAQAPLEPNAKPYPLKTCLVSGEELGKMGEAYRFTYRGQEIKVCCKACGEDFYKEPEKYLQKIAAAAGK